MTTCDLNCDMGEGIGNDAAIMPFISSANIACGYHAGDETTMRETVQLALTAGVAIGAHPSLHDRENFGRTENKDITPEAVYTLVTDQIRWLDEIAGQYSASLHHVKPHGALYNMAARDARLASAVAQAVFDYNQALVLYGLSGSYLIREGQLIGLRTASEVFADRTYRDDGSLTPRTESNALIENEEQSMQQVISMVTKGVVKSTSGNEVPIKAETICLHGDGKHAVAFAAAIRRRLRQAGIGIGKPTKA